MTPSEEQEDAWHLSQIRQRRSRLNAKPIGSVIRTLMARKGYGQTQAADELQARWQEAAGQVLGSHSRAGNVSRGVLQVFVADSSALQELHLCKKQVLAALQAAMPHANIRDFRARVG